MCYCLKHIFSALLCISALISDYHYYNYYCLVPQKLARKKMENGKLQMHGMHR